MPDGLLQVALDALKAELVKIRQLASELSVDKGELLGCRSQQENIQ